MGRSTAPTCSEPSTALTGAYARLRPRTPARGGQSVPGGTSAADAGGARALCVIACASNTLSSIKRPNVGTAQKKTLRRVHVRPSIVPFSIPGWSCSVDSLYQGL